MALELININKSYINQNLKKAVLKDINFSINPGEFISILGHSGCGKTTLINIIAGFIEKDSGEILLKKKELTGINSESIMVFQEDSLFPWLNVMENVEFGLKMKNISKEERREKAKKYIKLVNLEGYENLYVHQLSGGMKQRCAIARALVMESPIILMDEPFSALDHSTKEKLRIELMKIWEESKRTIIFVTHDVEEALLLADRIFIISSNSCNFSKEIVIDMERNLRKTSGYILQNSEKIKEEYGIVTETE